MSKASGFKPAQYEEEAVVGAIRDALRGELKTNATECFSKISDFDPMLNLALDKVANRRANALPNPDLDVPFSADYIGTLKQSIAAQKSEVGKGTFSRGAEMLGRAIDKVGAEMFSTRATFSAITARTAEPTVSHASRPGLIGAAADIAARDTWLEGLTGDSAKPQQR